MSPQLGLLARIQDLDLLINDLSDPTRAAAEEGLGFTMGSVDALEESRDALARAIDEQLLVRYAALRRRHPRAVATVGDGVCLGCFLRLPPRSVAAVRAHKFTSCDRCGRILVP